MASPAWGQRLLTFRGVKMMVPIKNARAQGVLAILTHAHTGLNLGLWVHGHGANIRGNHPQNTVDPG